jgi:hypothetical protein
MFKIYLVFLLCPRSLHQPTEIFVDYNRTFLYKNPIKINTFFTGMLLRQNTKFHLRHLFSFYQVHPIFVTELEKF